jgi:hypothetical protein
LEIAPFTALGQQILEIGDGALQAGVERHARLPIEEVARSADVGAALHRVVDRQRPGLELRARADEVDDRLGQLTVVSTGLPMLIGPVTSSEAAISRRRPSMRSSTKQKARVCSPLP